MKKPPANSTPDNPDPEEPSNKWTRAKKKTQERLARNKEILGGKIGNCVKCGNNKPLEGADIVSPSLIPRILCADCKMRVSARGD